MKKIAQPLRALSLLLLLGTLSGLGLSACDLLAQKPTQVAGGIGGTGISGMGGTGNSSGMGGTGISGMGGTGNSSGIGGTGISSGMGGTGITGVGVIQGFGSVFVNGREYFLDDTAQISIDGQPATEHDLQVGDVVVAKAAIDPASGATNAIEVSVKHAVRGKVEKISGQGTRITVLGQQIELTGSTAIQSAQGESLAARQIAVGDVVTVGALPKTNGTLAATLITRVQGRETAQQDSRFLLRGNVTKVSPDGKTLHIGAQRLAVAQLELPKGLKPGETVVISGRYERGAAKAEAIEHEPLLTGRPGERVEILGYVKASGKPDQIVSPGVALAYDQTTLIRGGTQTDLRTERLTALHGTVGGDGRIKLERMELGVSPLDYDLRVVPAKRPAVVEKAAKQQPPAEATSQERDEKTDKATTEHAADKIDTDKPDAEQSHNEKPDTESPDRERPEQKTEIEKPEIEKPQVDKPESAKPDKVERVEKPEKPEKTERPDISRPERIERPEQIERPDLDYDRPDKPERRD